MCTAGTFIHEILNTWDLKNYMPLDLIYNNLYRKISQIIPEEICSNTDCLCPICFDSLISSKKLYVGECGHVIHKSCMNDLLINNTN